MPSGTADAGRGLLTGSSVRRPSPGWLLSASPLFSSWNRFLFPSVR